MYNSLGLGFSGLEDVAGVAKAKVKAENHSAPPPQSAFLVAAMRVIALKRILRSVL